MIDLKVRYAITRNIQKIQMRDEQFYFIDYRWDNIEEKRDCQMQNAWGTHTSRTERVSKAELRSRGRKNENIDSPVAGERRRQVQWRPKVCAPGHFCLGCSRARCCGLLSPARRHATASLQGSNNKTHWLTMNSTRIRKKHEDGHNSYHALHSRFKEDCGEDCRSLTYKKLVCLSAKPWLKILYADFGVREKYYWTADLTLKQTWSYATHHPNDKCMPCGELWHPVLMMREGEGLGARGEMGRAAAIEACHGRLTQVWAYLQ